MELLTTIIWTTWLCIIAFLVYLLNISHLKGWEKIILLILGLNVAAELTAAYLSISQTNNGFIFNIMAPIERILTLVLYAKNSENRRGRHVASIGIILVIAIALYGIIHFPTFQEFHYGTYVASGLVIAVASYLHLRAMALDKAGQSFIIFVFSLANLVYFTLMISSLSAYGLASYLDNKFALKLFYLNLVAYALWSVILIIGMLWMRQKT